MTASANLLASGNRLALLPAANPTQAPAAIGTGTGPGLRSTSIRARAFVQGAAF